jgi:two-component system chemotaxis response regulator CheB
MPKEAVAHGGVDEVAHLNDLPKLVLNYLMANSSRALRV